MLSATGIMLQRTLKAAEELLAKGIRCKVIEVHTIKPIDAETISAVCKNARGVVTVEDHSIFGGLGSAVAEVLSRYCPTAMRMIGVQDAFGESAKDPESLYEAHHMTLEDIMQAAEELYQDAPAAKRN